MTEFIGYVLSGLVTGAVFALMASGLTLTYATTGVFNFAHGAIGFTSALVFFELTSGAGWPTWLAGLAAVVLAGPVLGGLLHKMMFRRLAAAGETAQIVATIGLSIALPAIGLGLIDLFNEGFGFGLPSVTEGGAARGLGPRPVENWELAGVTLDSDQLIAFGVALLMAVLLWALMSRTPLGLRMRAAVDRRTLAELRGVDVDRTSAQAWMLGSTLAAIAGVLAVPTLGLDSAAFLVLLFTSATAAVFGRLVSIPLTFAAGLVLGVLQNLVAGYGDVFDGVTGIRTAVPVVLLFVGLIVLNRSRGRVAGSIAEDPPPPDYLADLPRWRRTLPWAVSLAALLVWMFTIGDTYWTGVVAQGLLLALIFCSFVVVTGIGGMVNLAQAAFATMAALTVGLLLDRGLPLGAAIVLAVLAAAVAGAVVALPALRLGGKVLTLATLALALLADQVLFQIEGFGNNTMGWQLPALSLGFTDTDDPRTRVVLLLVLIGLVGLLVRNLEHSASGRAILAVRSAPSAAQVIGISATRTKITLFVLSSVIAGLGGVLFGLFNRMITITDMPAAVGFVWLAVVVVQGVRRVAGAVLAGLFMVFVPEILHNFTDSQHFATALFGLGGVGLAMHPDGLLSQVAERRYQRRRKQEQEERAKAAVEEDVAPADLAGHEEPAEEPARETLTVGEPEPAAEKPTTEKPIAEKPETEKTPSAVDALRLESAVAGYGDVTVLRGVDLAVPSGQVVALLGANGAGKSTTCLVAAGLVPPTSGRVYVGGDDVTDLPAHRRAGAGVFLAPEGRGVFPGLTVDENLALLLPEEARAEAYDRLPALAARRTVDAGALSGGEQQILALAPALVRPPRVLIADEPSLGLAPLIVDEIFQIFDELRRSGVALLVVEEKAGEVLSMADTVAFMRLGRVVWSGARSEVDEELLTNAYLGSLEATR